MKKYRDTNPIHLYRDCWEYVVACTMANCRHLSRQEAEDITSQAFLELYTKDKANIQNWVWTAKMRGRWNYVTGHARYKHIGTSAALPDVRLSDPEFFEVFNLKSLLIRKDAKACFDLIMKGYNSTEIAETLNRTTQGVKTMIYRLRKQAKTYLQRDIEMYNGGGNEHRHRPLQALG